MFTLQTVVLENPMHGDLILADLGFSVHESAGLHCSEIKIPSFTKESLN